MKQNFSSSKPRRGSPFDRYQTMASESEKHDLYPSIEKGKRQVHSRTAEENNNDDYIATKINFLAGNLQ